jgi:hypothetical protein
MTSFGPDKDFDVNTIEKQEEFISLNGRSEYAYSPTNGIVSDGDIIMMIKKKVVGAKKKDTPKNE